MFRTRRFTVGASTAAMVAVLALAVLAGCGNGADDVDETSRPANDPGPAVSSATSTEPMAEAEFVAAANEICASTRRTLEDVAASLNGNTDSETLASQLAARMVPAVQAQVAALDALAGPAHLEADLDPILEDILDILEQIEDDPVANLLEATDDPFAEPNERLLSLGLDVCAGRA